MNPKARGREGSKPPRAKAACGAPGLDQFLKSTNAKAEENVPNLKLFP
jgi:hypothetical protein